ncbi:MAG TPA: gluconate 2-dehydrogenase subunit 3 family protein [Bryobacteraceae bacterium]|nr:gluconate 2-dehydrogenase subunit 3 family protein [Bryobacteraceae bacterium]
MTRRDAAWAIVRAAAVAGAPEFLNAWMRHDETSAAPPEPDRWTNYEPKFFSAEEMKALDAFTAILIPTDETPGAREAHVVPFIDFVVAAAAEYEPELQDEWRQAMRRLHDYHFNQFSPADQLATVERMSHHEDDGNVAYELIKEMTVHAFYTSRIGLIDVLEYKGNAYLTEFPGCNHSEHHQI